jgi:hypothetical protein
VLADGDGTTTIPVAVRTLIKAGHGPTRGTFNGVLTGGNGRTNPAVMNTYSFDVPSGRRDVDVSAALSDPNDGIVGYLIAIPREKRSPRRRTSRSTARRRTRSSPAR